MRNRISLWGPHNRLLCAIALVAIIGFTMTGCDDINGLSKNDPQCDCTVKVHPYGSPCTCPAAGTPACTCTEEAPPVTGPECDCTVKIHPHGSPCTCPAEGTPACTCTEEGSPQCDCTVKVHPYGSPCTCPFVGTPACNCTEEGPPQCDCIETVHPYSSPCACPAEGTSFCSCTRAEPQPLTVTFNADNGTATTTQTVTEGDTVTRPANPAKSGDYGFEYWFNTATNIEWDFNAPVTANLTLKAKWSYKSLYVQMVYVGGGSFEMGRDDGEGDESPAHTVTLTGFYIGKYEVTQKQWETVMGWVAASPSSGKGDNYPVYSLSWYETLEFCNRLSILEGLSPAYSIRGTTDPDGWGTIPIDDDADYDDWVAWDNVYVVYGSNGYRLPTEAQWEYAAKGGPLASKPYYTYSGSNNANEVANTGGSLAQVGSLAANQLGIYDMSGNVFEWCWDSYDEEYYWEIRFDPTPNPSGPFGGSDRVVRGGNYKAQLKFASSVKRLSLEPDEWHDTTGFRLARPAQ